MEGGDSFFFFFFFFCFPGKSEEKKRRKQTNPQKKKGKNFRKKKQTNTKPVRVRWTQFLFFFYFFLNFSFFKKNWFFFLSRSIGSPIRSNKNSVKLGKKKRRENDFVENVTVKLGNQANYWRFDSKTGSSKETKSSKFLKKGKWSILIVHLIIIYEITIVPLVCIESINQLQQRQWNEKIKKARNQI